MLSPKLDEANGYGDEAKEEDIPKYRKVRKGSSFHYGPDDEPRKKTKLLNGPERNLYAGTGVA